MNIILLVHPRTLTSTSMPRFAAQIGEGMRARGHKVAFLSSPVVFSRTSLKSPVFDKWMSYIDQFIIFPRQLVKQVAKTSPDTLFVVVDQALGIWVSRISHRPHVIHCHDFLALRSALGEFPQNATSWTGRQYQSLIRKGFQKGRNFISVSSNSQKDLHRFLTKPPLISEVVYNGLNCDFRVLPINESSELLKDHLTERDEKGFILHVGGNQWYKNRTGVISMYAEYCNLVDNPLPLWLVGAEPSNSIKRAGASIPEGGCLRFLPGLSNQQVMAAYNLARIFLFPSIEEGFGWPIAEAMACGTRVITTGKAPMTEVGGDAATYLPCQYEDINSWAKASAKILVGKLNESAQAAADQINAGLSQAARFEQKRTIESYEKIYERVIEMSCKTV